MSAAEVPQRQLSGVIVGHSPLRVWALPSEVRLQRQLTRVGAVADASMAQRLVLLRADWIYDDALVRGLARSDEDVALVADDGAVVAIGMSATTARATNAAALLAEGQAPDQSRRVTAAQLADGYNDALRKREPPYLMPLNEADLPAIERRIFAGSYKGVTDLVTLYVWPAPARWVTRVCANNGITPNQVTSASLVLVFAAMWLFWTGHFGWGMLAERFYRVDPARSRETGGTGLGLSIVKHVVTKHGGEISVWSSENVGSTFTVRLPIHASLEDHK